MKSLFLFLLTLSFLGSCSRTGSLTETERSAVIEETRQTLTRYYDDIRKSGLTAEFNYLDHSPDFFWVPPGYASPLSYDSIAAILTRNAPALKSVENSFDTLRIVPLSRELASYTARLKSTVTDTAGNISSTSLRETGVMIRRNGEWKLLSGQTAIIN